MLTFVNGVLQCLIVNLIVCNYQNFICRDETEPEMISDDSAEKPTGWLDDEPELIPDPTAEKPQDW